MNPTPKPSGCWPVVKVLLIIFAALLGLIFIIGLIGSIVAPNTDKRQAKTTSTTTAAELLANFDARMAEGNSVGAKVVAETLISNFPQSAEAKSISGKIAALDAEIKKTAADAAAAEEKSKAAAAAQVKEDLASFRKERDEVNEITFYYSRDIPMSRVGNFFGLYMGIPDKGEPFLRWKFMYTSDDWLFIDKMTLKVDGERTDPIEFPFGSIKRDNSGGEIWEWHDELLSSDAEMLPFMKLAVAKDVIIRYDGQQYYKDRTLSEKEKQAMLKMMNAYSSLKHPQ